jgi:hypothetical protein
MAEASPKHNDWCHICGERPANLADVWYPANAEHRGKNTEYIRICVGCAEKIARIARGEDDGDANERGMIAWGRNITN